MTPVPNETEQNDSPLDRNSEAIEFGFTDVLNEELEALNYSSDDCTVSVHKERVDSEGPKSMGISSAYALLARDRVDRYQTRAAEIFDADRFDDIDNPVIEIAKNIWVLNILEGTDQRKLEAISEERQKPEMAEQRKKSPTDLYLETIIEEARSAEWAFRNQTDPDNPAGSDEAPEKDEDPKIATQKLIELYKSPRIAALPSALCLSGGGIRSATFALGVLKGLAKNDLLSRFDYLSTVSGGGYIGSWFSAWVSRKGVDSVSKRLSQRDSAEDVEPNEVRYLRSYGNFLSPRLGMLSADTWVLLIVFLRNLFLVWTFLIPALVAGLLVPKIIAALFTLSPDRTLLTAGLLTASLAGIWGFANVISMRPFLEPFFKLNKARTGFRSVLFRCVIPIFLMGAGFSWVAFWNRPDGQKFESGNYWQWPLEAFPEFLGIPSLAVYSVGIFVLGYVASIIFKIRTSGGRQKSGAESIPKERDGQTDGAEKNEADTKVGKVRGHQYSWLSYAKGLLFEGVIPGMIFGLLIFLLEKVVLPLGMNAPNGAWTTILYVIVAMPLVMISFAGASTIGVGLASKISDDMDREWLARIGAVSALVLVVFVLVMGVSLLGPLGTEAILANFGGAKTWIAAAIGTVSGYFTLVVGFLGGGEKKGKGKLALLGILLPMIGAPIFAAYLASVLALLADWALLGIATWITCYELMLIPSIVSNQFVTPESYSSTGVIKLPVLYLFSVFVGLVCLMILMGYRININKFSFHALYRERLSRAYLGASRDVLERNETANKFTGLDNDDNLCMSELSKKKPLHVVNMALNESSTDNLEWNYRRAGSFTVTPFHAGSSTMNNGVGCYRKVEDYGFNDQTGRSITLGTAMAISGAAVNPNMGYYTSARAVQLLMAFFNIRLGWWLGNPATNASKDTRLLPRTKRTPTWRLASPRFAPLPMLYEAFGMTNSERAYINLSDGGHFENLGLYEMIRRRVRFVLVVDAGADGDYSYSDLGNAIHKIRVDQGVSIEFRNDLEPKEGVTCAIADIHYSKIDGSLEGEDGVLVYIKPTLNGTEPVDIINYARENTTFPHETTADQMFNETQFESYRSLGEHMVNKILDANPEDSRETFSFYRFWQNAEALAKKERERIRN